MAINYLQQRRQEAVRALRGCNEDVAKDLREHFEETRIRSMEARKKLFEEDCARRAERAEKAAVEKAKKQDAEKNKALALELKDLETRIDREWQTKDFGQGTTSLDKKAAANIREVLDRLRLRAPTLSDPAAALWPRFREEFPGLLWREYQGAMGAAFVTRVKRVIEELGKHFIENPGLKTAKAKSAADGDEGALSRFVRYEMRVTHAGPTKLIV